MKFSLLFLLIVFGMIGLPRFGLAQSSGEILEISPVVVTATRQEEETLKVPSHVTVITQEDLARSNTTNVGDALKSEPGLWVVNTSGSAPTGILIDGRGFNNGGGNGSRMLVLIDGRRANLADSSHPDWAAIPVESVERIEVVRGPASALYGDNAMAGVINIITKKGSSEPVKRFTLEGGSYRYWKRIGSVSGTDEGLSYYLFGSYETADGYRENSDHRGSNYVGNFGYQISPLTTLRFRSGYLSNERLFPGALTASEMETVGRRGSLVSEDFGATRQGQFDIGLESQLDEGRRIELTAGKVFRGDDFRITFPGAGVSESARDLRSTSVSGNYRTTGPFGGDRSRLMLGVDLLKERVESPSTFTDTTPTVSTDRVTYERRLIGAYAHEEFSVVPSILLTLSGRMDWSVFQYSQESTAVSGERGFRIWSPMAGLSYLTTPYTSLFANWSRSFRFPNRDELTGLFGFTPELDPETARTIELGNKIQAGKRFEATASVFRSVVQNEIIYVPPPLLAAAFGQNENLPEVRHDGLEVSARLQPGESLRLKGGYTMTRTEILEGPFQGSRLPITPKHAGSAGIDLGKEEGYRLSLAGRFVGKRFLANDLANQAEKLPAYSVYDGRLSYQGVAFEFFFGVNNVFNRKYEDFGGLGGFPFGTRIGFNPSPERNYIGGGTMTF